MAKHSPYQEDPRCLLSLSTFAGKTSSWRAITPSTGIKSSREILIVYLRTNVHSTHIGTDHPRALQLLVVVPVELKRQVNQVSRRRDQHGYRQVSALYAPALAGIAA